MDYARIVFATFYGREIVSYSTRIRAIATK